MPVSHQQPQPQQQHVQPQQQRFFNNNNFNNGNQNFNNQNRFKPLPHYQQQPQQQQRQPPMQQQQQQQGQAPNPFIPLQASRKATKAKNIQSEPKKAQQKQAAAAQQKEIEKISKPSPVATSHIESDVKNVSVNQPQAAVQDNRKCRLAINFGK